MREAVFVPASRLYDVESGTVIAHPATQASDEDVRRALEDREIRADGGHSSSGIERSPFEQYFSRIGATRDIAEELAEEFDSVADFLETPFEDKLRAVVGTRAAQKIAAEYKDFEYMRDVGSCRAFRSLEGVGGESAMRVDYSYIRRTVSTPRDVLTAKEVAEKMGFVTEHSQPAQAELGNWNEIPADSGCSLQAGTGHLPSGSGKSTRNGGGKR